ncbi:IMP cyclohydrolase, partial [Myxococcota bacterium]|nr:IMP cyclohydrolase [Myxococcota bacterium]
IQLPVLGELADYGHDPRLILTTLRDGGLVVELSQVPRIQGAQDLTAATHTVRGVTHRVKRSPEEGEIRDMLIAWAIASGVTSNSVVMVRDGVTTAIGTGEQDRVGAVKLAVQKAYTKYKDALVYHKFGVPLFDLEREIALGKRSAGELVAIEEEVAARCGGLKGSVLASDGFFPFRDGVDAALEHGITGFIQPGGSLRDYESIAACNGAGATMVFTNQRVFRH